MERRWVASLFAGILPPGNRRLPHGAREARVLEFFEEHKGVFLQILRGNLPTLVPGKDKGCAEMIGMNIDYMRRALAEAVKLGQVRKLDPHTAAVALFGIVRGFVFVRIVGDLEGPLPRRFEGIWDLFFRGVSPE